MKILLISGKQGSGKTTLAKSICKEWEKYKGHRAIEVNFAGPLREMHDFIIGYLESRGIKRDIKKDGPLMQVLGTEWGRNTVDPDLWVKLCKANIQRMQDDLGHVFTGLLFVVADCRFRNEFDWFPEALRIRLNCNHSTRRERCEAWRPNDEHVSETDLDAYEDEGRFEFSFDSGKMQVEEITSLVMARLL